MDGQGFQKNEHFDKKKIVLKAIDTAKRINA